MREEEIERFVDSLYISILGRPADEEGKRNYVERIKSGTLKKELLESILRTSEEYRERISIVQENREIANFVKAKYLDVLDRLVDSGGLVHYTKEIVEGRIKEEELETILMQSEEYKAKHL